MDAECRLQSGKSESAATARTGVLPATCWKFRTVFALCFLQLDKTLFAILQGYISLPARKIYTHERQYQRDPAPDDRDAANDHRHTELNKSIEQVYHHKE